MKLLFTLPLLAFQISAVSVSIDPTNHQIKLPWGLCLKGRFHRRAVTTRTCKDKRKYHWEHTMAGSIRLMNSNNLCLEVKNPTSDNSKLVMRECADKATQKFIVNSDGKWDLVNNVYAGKCVFYDEGKNRNIRYGVDPNYVPETTQASTPGPSTPGPSTPDSCDACLPNANGVCTREPNSGTGMYCKCDQTNGDYVGQCMSGGASNSPSCSSRCANGSICRNTEQFPSSYYCMCPDGYDGVYCDDHVSLDDCTQGETCRNGGTCTVNPNGGHYCECTNGWTGAYCQDVDNGPDPLSNCWACVMSWNSDGTPGKIGVGVCTTEPVSGEGQYCKCSNSLYGRKCAQSKSTFDQSDCSQCNSAHSDCTADANNQFWCDCHDGYTGEFCDDRIFLLNCESGVTCGANGTCTFQMNNGEPGYYCACSNGASGAYCEM